MRYSFWIGLTQILSLKTGERLIPSVTSRTNADSRRRFNLFQLAAEVQPMRPPATVVLEAIYAAQIKPRRIRLQKCLGSFCNFAASPVC
jgi:hypothetical protein